jgi:hypothetical protein
VLGRLITDNIITAYECLHFIKRNKSKKHQHCALKLDMRKAYDLMEWSYLQAIMLPMGFNPVWVELVMRMVSVLFNWSPTKAFKPTWGILQGDLISPYLFFACRRWPLIPFKIYKRVLPSSHLEGLKVASSAPTVNHLVFADDSCCLWKRVKNELDKWLKFWMFIAKFQSEG